ncbi:acyltransferase family protein [Caldibacillus lycopersici]|uniref:Acyltransferase family protein n=1 Tax=Perspicuibacillus lycopersici TaxID=1325689 RepID=A0AAE3LM33_9BACI|nr:acyltransferase family protein [Perspicuibacillus lycopersici]MCU9612297.1 acyltransferase family protein [Perspicuibacillus lycopersici]
MNKRDFYFDNAKFLLIFFVVFGHLIQSFTKNNDVLYALYKTIYTFHMPAFILISGHFAKGFLEKDYIWKLMKKLLFPYMLFQLIYTIYYYFLLHQQSLEFNLLNPAWSLWFLISLFCWNLMLPLFAKMRPLAGLMLTFMIGIAIGYVESVDNFLSLSRTFVFFPFFLLGYHLRREHFQTIASKQYKILAISIAVCAFIIFYFYPIIDEKWLLGSKPYAQMVAETSLGATQRLIVYCISLIMSTCFLALVPKRKYSFTKIGKYTLYVYLLHGFIVKYFRQSVVEQWLAEHHLVWILVVAALAVVLLLSSPFIRIIAQPLIEMSITRWKKIWRRIRNVTNA